MRKHIGLINSENNTYRLVHGEGDNLPGLIIDIYGNTAVLQAHSVGMHSDREKISEALRAVYGSDNLKTYFINQKGPCLLS